jgi:hypothetical protein
MAKFLAIIMGFGLFSSGAFAACTDFNGNWVEDIQGSHNYTHLEILNQVGCESLNKSSLYIFPTSKVEYKLSFKLDGSWQKIDTEWDWHTRYLAARWDGDKMVIDSKYVKIHGKKLLSYSKYIFELVAPNRLKLTYQLHPLATDDYTEDIKYFNKL